MDHRSSLGPGISRVRKVFRGRPVFLDPPAERAHRDHLVSKVSRVIRTLLGLRTHPEHRVPPVLPDLQGLPVLHGRRDFRAMTAQIWPRGLLHRRSRSRFEPSAVVCPRRRRNSDRLIPRGGMDVILGTSAPLWNRVVSHY